MDFIIIIIIFVIKIYFNFVKKYLCFIICQWNNFFNFYYCRLYFITKGLVKNYINTDTGESKIYNFRTENMQVTGYALYNYKENLKALVNVRCIEDCVMIKVPFSVIQHVIEHTKNGERLGRYMAECHVIEMMQYIIERDSISIIDRYNGLELKYPNIHNRLPQHMIASYLGITPVHLSNLKKNRKIILEEMNT